MTDACLRTDFVSILSACMSVATRESLFFLLHDAGHSKGGNVVLLYASQYDDVPLFVNVAGRCVVGVKIGVMERVLPNIWDDLVMLDTWIVRLPC